MSVLDGPSSVAISDLATAPGASVAEYKRDARIDIEKKGYTIIANIGDQRSDLAFAHAERIFKIPNPFYYLP